MTTLKNFHLFLFTLALVSSTVAGAQGFDPNPVWPLCGNYYASAPGSWDPETDGCPSSRWGASYPDTINDTYGPRLSTSNQYDWHRGLDLHTANAIGKPVFAFTCGRVIEVDDTFNGVLMVEHYRDHDCDDPLPTRCGDAGCYYSRYRHLADVADLVDTVGAVVAKGQYVGQSGKNCSRTGSCYPHVHFELRNAPGAHDPQGRGERDAIHPLHALAYDTSGGASNLVVTIPSVDATSPTAPIVSVRVRIANDQLEIDLNRVEVTVYDNTGSALVPVTQSNPGAAYTTPEGVAYEVHPPFFDMELWSRQYNYKHTGAMPYSTFLPPSANMSPYADSSSTVYDPSFPSSYDADFHLEAKLTGNAAWGDFNGVEVYSPAFNRTTTYYTLDLRFKQLAGPPTADRLCIKARALDVRGAATSHATWGNCSLTS